MLVVVIMGLGAVVVLGLEMADSLVLVLLGCCCSLRLGTEDLNDDDIAAESCCSFFL